MSEIKGIEIKDILGLSQPLSKLVEYLSYGIGKIYAPHDIRKITGAKCDAINSICETIRKNSDLPIQFSDSGISIDLSNSQDITSRSYARTNYQNICAQQNLESIVKIAYEELENEESVPDESVDTMWALRFFKSIEDVTDETLQKMWGRILAGEIKQPKSFSLRTLSLLQNISQNEAMLFQRIAALVLKHTSQVYFIFCDEEINKKYHCSFGDLLTMEECGLAKAEILSLNLTLTEKSYSYIFNNKIIALYETELIGLKKISIDVFALSEVGAQLYRLIDKKENKDYVVDYFKKNYTKNSEYKLSIHNVSFVEGNKVSYFKGKDLMLAD